MYIYILKLFNDIIKTNINNKIIQGLLLFHKKENKIICNKMLNSVKNIGISQLKV